MAVDLRLAIAGLGAIGREVALRIDRGSIAGVRLAAVSARDQEKAKAFIAGLVAPVPVVPVAALAEVADVVLECLPAGLFRSVAEPALQRGRLLMPLSVGALLDHMDLVELAKRTGGRIVVPTGALLGLDAVRAVSEGIVYEAAIETRKPPGGLAGAPHLIANGISVEGITAPLRVFAGSAREAIRGFPANVNVAVALSLAGVGPDRTRVEIWADPSVSRNTHTIRVRSDSSDLTMIIESIPSPENPRTGVVTALSAVAALRRLASPLVVGT
jgi:aspartate dehydrogenase